MRRVALALALTLLGAPVQAQAPRGSGRPHRLEVAWAHNFDRGLQVVPGLAIPMGLGPSRGDEGLFVYLSFEHPFRREP